MEDDASQRSEHDARATLGGSRVLVTGADGFLGSHLVERLVEEGAVVSALVRPSSTNGTVGFRLRNLGACASRLDAIVAADIAGRDVVEQVVRWRPDVIFHLAADAYVERSFEQPAEVLRTNLDGTMNMLAAARRLEGLRRLVVTSSSEIYGPARTEAIAEAHALEPTSPYAASKLAADRMAMAFHTTYGIPVAVIRPFNTFGPRHVYDVIPKFLARALAGEPIVVYGNGLQSRDFCWVEDMVEAFVQVGTHPEAIGRAVNFGTGVATAIGELAALVKTLAESSSEIVQAPARRAEVARLCCDHSLATRLFGWHPTVSLTEGLRRNITWARRFRAERA
jgi:NDP-hexose 4,6-dehydratase